MASRYRPWVFTLNNPTDEEYKNIQSVNEKMIKCMIVSWEIGGEGTGHLQGYVDFKHARSMKAVKTWLGTKRVHLERRKGTAYEAYGYCKPFSQGGTDPEKTESNCQVIMELGEEPLEVELSAWERIVQMIKDGESNLELAERYPHEAVRCAAAIDKYRLEWDRAHAGWRDVKVTYLSGDTGTGKTRSVMEEYGYANVYRATCKKNPFDGYAGQEVLVFEEFRSQHRIEEMLNWLDGYPIELPARYADKMAKFTKVYIISNWELDEQYVNVQLMHPKTWMALLRRIDEIRRTSPLESESESESKKNPISK